MRRTMLSLFAMFATAAGTPHAAVPDYAGAPPEPATASAATAVFAGGCFWGDDAGFKQGKGVLKGLSG